MRVLLISFILCTFFVGCAVESVQITYTKRAKCDKKLAESYGIFTYSLLKKPKWTVLELYKDSTFMFAGDLSMSMGNELFCLKGFYRKDTNVIKLRETYRQVSTNLTNIQRYNQFGKFGANSQFRGFDAIYLFAPIDTLGVLNLQMEGKDYKITQVLDATFKQLDSGYVKTTLGNLPTTTTWQQDFMLKPVA